jgi:hypothetical protein
MAHAINHICLDPTTNLEINMAVLESVWNIIDTVAPATSERKVNTAQEPNSAQPPRLSFVPTANVDGIVSLRYRYMFIFTGANATHLLAAFAHLLAAS